MKERLDVLLVKKKLAPSREKAKAVIMSGIVYVDGQKEDKAGAAFEEDAVTIEVRGNTLPFVSRGGLKLEKAFSVFPISVKGMICLDTGCVFGRRLTAMVVEDGSFWLDSVDRESCSPERSLHMPALWRIDRCHGCPLMVQRCGEALQTVRSVFPINRSVLHWCSIRSC